MNLLVPYLIMGRVTYIHHHLQTLYIVILRVGRRFGHFIFKSRRLKSPRGLCSVLQWAPPSVSPGGSALLRLVLMDLSRNTRVSYGERYFSPFYLFPGALDWSFHRTVIIRKPLIFLSHLFPTLSTCIQPTLFLSPLSYFGLMDIIYFFFSSQNNKGSGSYLSFPVVGSK